MKIVKGLLLILSFSLVFVLSSCKEDEDEVILGNWIDLSDFEGVARNGAVAFSIDGTAYLGLGYNGESRLNDFWSYDSERNHWTQLASFPGDGRNAAVAFSASGKGYVGTGYNGLERLNDFWEYDPVADSWTQIADFPGTARYGAVAMSINNIGYVGSGFDGNYLKDFYAYDPTTNTWEQKTSIGGSKRMHGVAFSLNGKGYITTGINNGIYVNDLLEYDPSADLWTEKRKISNISDESYDDSYTIIRTNAVAFVIGNKAYITSGTSGSIKSDTWEYDPVTDLWTVKTSFEGTGRTDAVAFSISNNTKGFVATGRSGSFQLDDIWEFKPYDEYNSLD